MGDRLSGYRTPLKAVRNVLENPLLLWKSASLEGKHALLRLLSTTPLEYEANGGYRTPNLSLPYRFFREMRHQKEGVVDPACVEEEIKPGKEFDTETRKEEFWNLYGSAIVALQSVGDLTQAFPENFEE